MKDRERESLDSQGLKSHVHYAFICFNLFFYSYLIYSFFKTEQVMTEAEERYLKLENRRLKTEELLNTSNLEVQSLKTIIHNMEKRIENLKENEMSHKNSINQLTNMLEEEQINQQDMFNEVTITYLLYNIFE